MANYATLKAAIQQVVKTNGDNEITGALLQQSLLSMINSLGVGYQFVGIATPTTNPGTPDQKVFYIAIIPGAYSNFSGIIIDSNEIAILTYSGQWDKIAIPVVNQRAIDVIYNELLFYDSDNLTPYFYDLTGNKAIKYDGIEARFRSIIIPCEKNDSFLIKTVGGANGRAWGIVDESLNILACADANANLLSGYTLNITQDNAAYLIVNDNINVSHAKELFAVEKNGAIIQKVNKNTKDVTNISDNINGLYDVFYDKMGEDTIFGYIDVTYEKFWNNIRIVADKAMIFNNDRLKSITIKSFGSANSQASIAYIYDENDILVQSFELGIVGTENTTFDLVDKNIILRPGYSVAVKGISYANFNSTNRFYDYDSNSYITTYCYGISITVERNTTSQRINLNTERINTIYNTFQRLLTPNIAFSGQELQISGNFPNWYGFTELDDLDYFSGILYAIDFGVNATQDSIVRARTAKKVRDSDGVLIGTTPIREFTFIVRGGTSKVVLVDRNIDFGPDYVLEVDFTALNSIRPYFKQSEITGYARILNGTVTSGSIWSIKTEVAIITAKEINDSKKTLKILSVGNSFSEDAFNYAPWILKNICPEIDLTFGTLYRGGSTLAQHYSSFLNNTNDYSFRKWQSNNNDWETIKSSANDLDALGNEKWDIILFQQESNSASDYSTYQPYLNDIIKLLFSKIDYPVKLGWLITPSNRSNYEQSVTDFNAIITAVQRVINETAIDFVIPCGTAIQNARTTTLQTIGDDGNLTKSSHLQEGLPCQIDSYAAVIALLNIAGFQNKSIYGDTIRATASWLNGRTIFGPNGSSVGVTDANCRIGQICAMVANKIPLQITNCSEL